MILVILRALFVLVMAAVGWSYIKDPKTQIGPNTWLALAIAVAVGVLLICIDMLAPRRKLAIFSGTFFGLLVGIIIAYALSFVTPLVVDQYQAMRSMLLSEREYGAIIRYINLLVGVVTCYLSISFILQTKDDFRFVIPYVEFRKQTKGSKPFLLDTSVLIDGRISDIASTGVIESTLIVPKFILLELQQIADSADRLKRNRGRRGLDTLQQLQQNRHVEVVHYDSSARQDETIGGVDEQLLHLAKDLNGRVLTNDFNLNKVAQLREVDVININDLANALKPVVLPGEKMIVRLQKPGDEAGQGVGYLDDGTMVVVEQGRAHLGEDVEFTVTSTLQTKQGKMIFGRLGPSAAANAHDASGEPAPATPKRTPPPPSRQRSGPSPPPLDVQNPAHLLFPFVMPDFAVILPAAGVSARFGAERDKLLEPLDGLSVIAHSVNAFLHRSDVVEVIIPTRRPDLLAPEVPRDTRRAAFAAAAPAEPRACSAG